MKRIALTLLIGLLAAPALAKPPTALVRCDGYGGRRGGAESFARSLAVLGTLGLIGGAEPDNPEARDSGEKGLAACTEALTDPRVTGNMIRRAEVLLMRGVRNFEMGNFDAAVADADAVQAIALPPQLAPAYARSLKVSALLLSAQARLGQKRDAEAEALAVQAADLRPFAPLILTEALAILAVSPGISVDEARLLDRIMALAPTMLRVQAREAAGDWRGAASDYPVYFSTGFGPVEKPDVVLASRQAVVKALAGDRAGAEATLAEVQQRIDELAASASGTDAKAQEAAQKVARADELTQLARAQLAVLAGRIDEARSLLSGRSRWLAPAPIVTAVATNISARMPPMPPMPPSMMPPGYRPPADAVATARAARSNSDALKRMTDYWPRWEDIDVASGFGRDLASRPSTVTIQRVRDDGATIIQVDRAAFADTAYEAALLLAARTASAQGASRFAVMARATAVDVYDDAYRPKRVGGFSLDRTGLMNDVEVLQIVTPSDRLWSGHDGHSLAVADVEAALGPLFPAPVPQK